MLVRDIKQEEAKKVVNKVFERCYKDLEPFGRIARSRSNDPYRFLAEGSMYGYSE